MGAAHSAMTAPAAANAIAVATGGQAGPVVRAGYASALDGRALPAQSATRPTIRAPITIGAKLNSPMAPSSSRRAIRIARPMTISASRARRR